MQTIRCRCQPADVMQICKLDDHFKLNLEGHLLLRQNLKRLVIESCKLNPAAWGRTSAAVVFGIEMRLKKESFFPGLEVAEDLSALQLQIHFLGCQTPRGIASGSIHNFIILASLERW